MFVDMGEQHDFMKIMLTTLNYQDNWKNLTTGISHMLNQNP